jgi:hypothetical protein
MILVWPWFASSPDGLAANTGEVLNRLLRFAVSHCLLQPASSRLQRFLYAARHGVNRGIQRGTLVRKLSYSMPNVCLSVGSSYITTKT